METKLLGIYGLDIARRAMRNPMKSWEKASEESDLLLFQALLNGGDEESKILRFIDVYLELDWPRYLWSEADTYKIGFDMMSESTMHRLMIDGVDLEDFEFDMDDLDEVKYYLSVCNYVNSLVDHFQKSTDKDEREKLRVKAKGALPESFLQMRTIKTNVQTLRRIYRQRKGHRLPMWREFCDWLAELPEIGWMITYEPVKKLKGFRLINKETGEECEDTEFFIFRDDGTLQDVDFETFYEFEVIAK